MNRTAVSFAVIIAVLTVGCTGTKDEQNLNVGKSSQDESRKVVRMGAVPAAYYLPLFVAQEKGLLKNRGYESDLQIFAKNTDMMDAFLNGDLQVVAQSSGTIFPLEAKYPDQYRLVYAQNNRSYSFVVQKDSNIKSIADLRGKIVGTWPSPTAALCIKLCVKSHFSPDEVTIQPVEFKLLNQVLLQGDVDAVFNTDVFTQQGIRTAKIRFMQKHPLTDEVMDPFFSGGAFVSPKLIEDDPAMAQDIQDAFEEAIAFIKDNDREARMLMKKYVPADEEALLFAELDEFITVSEVDVENAQKLADIFVEEGLMDTKIDVAPLFYGVRKREEVPVGAK